MATITQIDILRHGLPEGDNCLRGHTDFALTEQGFNQMQLAVQGLKTLDTVVTSTLQRCAVFAEHIAETQNLEINYSDDWKEMDFGEWDGLTHQQLIERVGEDIDAYWYDPWQVCDDGTAPHKGETLEQFDCRIKAAWRQLLQQFKGKKILLVTHSGVMRQLLRQLFEMPQNTVYLHRINLPYAARVRITVYHDGNQDWPQLQWPPYSD
ncbi:histidine phosphatase family protein [Photobacterium leiognathi]|uniref:histidine phosphatase family protein n=1 Tax=Photobacterium leiognathi TaxID=553611 RepID=UPI002981D38D|nr:histidine phosphatase family protein [Photobacterium leiognathi]